MHRIPASQFGETHCRRFSEARPGALSSLLIRLDNIGLFYVLLLITYILCIACFTHNAAADTNTLLKQAEQIQKKKVARLKSGMTKQKEKIAKNKEQEHLLYNELKKIDQKLMEQQKTILNSQRKLLRQENFLEAKEIEFTLIREDKQKAEAHIKNRLRAYYQMGEIGIINTIFSASTLPELLNIKEYFRSLFQYDRLVIKQYKDKLALLDGARAEILKGKETLLATIVLNKNQEKELISSRQERAKLLRRIQTEEGLYKQALTEMQKSAADLTETFKQYKKNLVINATKKKIQPSKSSLKSRPKNFFQDFPSQQGKLPPPIDNGTVINSFGKSKGVFGVEIDSNGIDIQAPNDSSVQAVYNGTIVFAGELPEYGNMVIVDHGQQYFTLVSRLNTIKVRKGDTIRQGEAVGSIVKEQSGLLRRGLHFEVRSGSTPQDPLLWLDSSLLSFSSSKK